MEVLRSVRVCERERKCSCGNKCRSLESEVSKVKRASVDVGTS